MTQVVCKSFWGQHGLWFMSRGAEGGLSHSRGCYSRRPSLFPGSLSQMLQDRGRIPTNFKSRPTQAAVLNGTGHATTPSPGTRGDTREWDPRAAPGHLPPVPSCPGLAALCGAAPRGGRKGLTGGGSAVHGPALPPAGTVWHSRRSRANW